MKSIIGQGELSIRSEAENVRAWHTAKRPSGYSRHILPGLWH